MKRSPSHSGFTLIEMIVVMAVIVILVSLVLSVNSAVQKKSASSRTKAEIAALGISIENYIVDNAGPPRSEDTDALDPRVDGSPISADGLKRYRAAAEVLYKALSGDPDLDGKVTEKSYAGDFFRPERLKFDNEKSADRKVEYIRDPFGNCYGYSTAGLTEEENYRQEIRKNPKAERPKDDQKKGYNPTYDIWSTGGTNIGKPTDADRIRWIKNW